MRLRSLLILAFCFVWSTVALQAQEDAKALTDEEDARVATVAARQEAVRNLLTTGNQFHDAGDEVKAARAWNRAGRFQLKLNQPEEAIATYRRALNVLSKVRNLKTRIDSLNGLAGAYKHATRYDEANPLLQRAILLSNKNNYIEGKAEALLIRPYCIVNKAEALQSAQQSLELWKSINHKFGQAQAYLVVGEHQIIQNNLIEATRNYETARKLWEELNVPNQVAEALINFGFIEARKGAWQASLSFYIQAQQLIVEEAAEPYMMGQINGGLAEAFVESGVPETGLDKYRQSLEYFRQTNYAVPIVGIQWAIGTAHYYLGNFSEALAVLKTTRAEASDKQVMEAAFCDDFLGRTYYAMNDYPAALRHYQAALEGFTRSENPMEAARTVALMGQVYQQQGNFKNAKANYLKALASFKKLSDQLNESATLYALGTLELQQNSVDAAEDYLSKSIEMTETMRRVSISADLTAAFSARVHDRYEKYIDCMMRKHQASPSQGLAKAAFETSELARARSLTELLHATQADLFPGLELQIAEQEKRLRGYLNSNENAKIRLLSGKYETAELKALDSEYQRLKAEHDQIIQDIRARNPSYEQVIQPTAWDLSKIQQQVVADDQTVLLEYSLGSEKSYLWAITRSGMKSYDLPAEEQITKVAGRVYKLLSKAPLDNTDNDLSSALQELAEMILLPAAEHLNSRRIIVVPDGVLNYIPFQVLPSLSNNKPLVEEKEIINAPSASILGELQEEAVHRQPAPNIVAAFGDPVFATDYSQAKGADNNEQAVATARFRSALRDSDLNGAAFDPTAVTRLFHAKRELDSLREVAGEKALIVNEFDATRERFLNTDLTQFAILHLVTHGFFNQKHPENSGFVLSDINREQKQVDGFVGLREIYELRAPVLLVVLSACQTALGENVRGEGLMGLTRGFMHAGASSVVASLWEVDDRATAELMKLFYSNMLQRGMKTGEALRAAQNSIRQRPEWRSPHYWAAFTLQGEYPQAIKANSEARVLPSRSTIFVMAGLLLLGCAILWFWLRSRGGRAI